MQLKIYAQNSYKKWLLRFDRRQTIADRLSIAKIPNAAIVIDPADIYSFGVYDARGKFIRRSEMLRNDKGRIHPGRRLVNAPMKFYGIDAVYLGDVDSHFGHFLLEHMNRAYPFLTKEYADLTAVIVGKEPVPKFATGLLELMGIKKLIILDGSARFRNLFVPQQGFNIPYFSSAQMGESFDQIAANAPAGKKWDKVYVSRAALQAKVFGEEKIQNIFAKNGYHIIYPETLPVPDQIAIVKNVRFLAGCGGTALHLSLFMGAGGTVINLRRNNMRDNGPFQHLINKTKKLNSIFVASSIESHITEHGSAMPQIIGANEYLRQFFDDMGFDYDSKDMEFDAGAWNDYERAWSDYLAHNKPPRMEKIKHWIIRITACFIPGRRNRGRWRKYLRRVL